MKGDYEKHDMSREDLSTVVMATDLFSGSTMVLDRETNVDSLIWAPHREFRLKNPHFLIVYLKNSCDTSELPGSSSTPSGSRL